MFAFYTCHQLRQIIKWSLENVIAYVFLKKSCTAIVDHIKRKKAQIALQNLKQSETMSGNNYILHHLSVSEKVKQENS